MRTRSPVSAVAGLVLGLLVVSVATLSPAGATTHSAAHPAARARVRAVPSSYDAQVLYWTNLARRQHGVRPLRAGSCVDRFAERWDARMAARDVFKHQHLRRVLRRCHRHAAAENIAYGTGSFTAYRVVQMWMHSPGHRHNLLNPRLTPAGRHTSWSS